METLREGWDLYLPGLIISILRLVTKASFPNTMAGLGKSAVVYFVISAAWVSGCLVLHTAGLPHNSNPVDPKA
jgi:hypothetical protein